MYKEDLALNNLQGLTSSKTKPNQTNFPIERKNNETKKNYFLVLIFVFSLNFKVFFIIRKKNH